MGYQSKTLPKACQNYSATELEMTGLLCNIKAWEYWLGKNEFDCAVDHAPAVQIMNSKNPPATARIGRLLEMLSTFNFVLYYVKGKDMVLCDFLSRTPVDPDNPHELIPIAFNIKETRDIVDSWINEHPEQCMVVTRRQTQAQGVAMPPVHGAGKALDPGKKPEHQQAPRPVPQPPPPPPVARPQAQAPPPVDVAPPLPPPAQVAPARPPDRVPLQRPRVPIARPQPSVARTVASKLLEKAKRGAEQRKPLQPLLPKLIKKVHEAKVQKRDRQAGAGAGTLPRPPAPPVPPVPPGIPAQAPKPAPQAQPVPQAQRAPPYMPLPPQPPLDIPRPQPPPAPPTDEPGGQPLAQPHEPEAHVDPGVTDKYPDLPPAQPRRIYTEPVYRPDPYIDLGGPPNIDEVEPSFRTPVRQDFQVPPSLEEQLEDGQMVHRYLPKQVDIERLLRQIQRKILRQTRFPDGLKDIQAAYLNSPHFRDVYLFLLENKLPSTKIAAKRVQQQAPNYMTLDTLLFYIPPPKDPDGEYTALLCIPTSKVDMLLQAYHSSLIGGHQGISKTTKTIAQRFLCPNLGEHVRAYIMGCHVCQMFKEGKKIQRPLQKRININTPPLAKIHMDIKHMPKSKRGYAFILVILCETTNFLVAIPLKRAQAQEVCEALKDRFIGYFGTPSHLICDQDPAFMASISQYFMEQANIKLITVSPENHQSLLAEHGIKSLANILMKHLSGAGAEWDQYLSFAMLSYNMYTSPNLDLHSPYQLVFGKPPKLIRELEVVPEVPITGTFKDYYEKLRKSLRYLQDRMVKFRDRRQELWNKDRTRHLYSAGQIVYLHLPSGALLQTGSRKIRCQFVGPLVIYRAVSPTQFLLMSLDGVLYPYLIEEARIKPGHIRTTQGNVSTLADLKTVLRTALHVTDIAQSAEIEPPPGS